MVKKPLIIKSLPTSSDPRASNTAFVSDATGVTDTQQGVLWRQRLTFIFYLLIRPALILYAHFHLLTRFRQKKKPLLGQVKNMGRNMPVININPGSLKCHTFKCDNKGPQYSWY